ncbi:asparagine synthase (glutamine-hydrolysing) [Desulfocicer vacuolatum DSM 3385]|uniref:asparagine synthase (glutamine-hydrolyzing) n=1 Tax=Desulfocicer vacuolatum DSM 3385 TaxID=1121400 RepID=A0A1W2DVW9_9BACT|nr:N-acetylglutaminylglutamine amidotransferase [Desulfocicer vacuolatum]SMD01695.1 asparagine synthase (glutamine-hydrolysing) [Desulfocicer vacuolatum DSM 3385]
MCGICGELFFDNHLANEQSVKIMNKAMGDRGPDHEDIYHGIWTSFGHRRLKIIDLSNASNQPFIDPSLGMTLVFNGAIYNYKELRADLKQMGYAFYSKGDTEVILKAYHAWGENCVEKFNGMFSFALYDQNNNSVFMARDRLGIKPLYFYKSENSLIFASSLPALLKTGRIKSDISTEALHYYMSLHAVVPAPHTIIEGIKKLPPATVMTVKKDGTMIQRAYWNLNFDRDAEEEKYNFNDWKRYLSFTLKNAVKRRLVADVPVGVLLSGGLDSSLIVGLLAQAGQKDLKTFSIGFESVGGEKGDEFQYSDIIARHFGTDHHKITVDSDQVLPSMDACVKAMNEPMVSHDCIGFYLLSQEVAKHVKVVQSGQGADEIFGGYHWYPPMLESKDAVQDYRNLFCDRSNDEFQNIVHEKFQGLDFTTEFIEKQFSMPGAGIPIDKALRIDSTVMLVDDPVKRVDSMTMAWSLEARVPFLDHELVELAAKMPAEYKVGNGGKYILKEAARELIPSEVIDRPKGYFPVPALKYIQGKYLDTVTKILKSEACRSRGIIRNEYMDVLLESPEAHITPLRGSKLWQVALLEFWMQKNGI